MTDNIRTVEIDETRHIIGLLRAAQTANAKGYSKRVDAIAADLKARFTGEQISAARWQQMAEDCDTTSHLVRISGVEAITEEPTEADTIAHWLDLAERMKISGRPLHVAMSDQLRAQLFETYGPERVNTVKTLIEQNKAD